MVELFEDILSNRFLLEDFIGMRSRLLSYLPSAAYGRLGMEQVGRVFHFGCW